MIITNPINEIFIPSGLEDIKHITKRYLDTIEQMGYMPEQNLIKHRRLTLPTSLLHLKTEEERQERKKEYFKRWKHGYEGLNGTMYAYHNYASIQVRAGGGSIRPRFREYTNKTFELIESCLYGVSKYYGDNRGSGIVFLSKRGWGKSAETGHAANSVISTNKETSVNLSSKDEEASDKFLREKVKFNVYRQPSYLRFSIMEDNRGVLHVGKKGKDQHGNTIIFGNDSRITSRAPTLEAMEGGGARLWIHDEAGKTKNLLQLIDNTLPTLNGEDGMTRVGVPIITGVAGDFDKFGSDYIELWERAEERKFIRWFVPAFAGLFVDEYGNEDIEQSVEQIMTERYRLFHYNNDQRLNEEMQKFPLTPEEALQSTNTSIFNKKKLFYQAKLLASNDDYLRRGNLEWDSNRQMVDMKPDNKNGKISFLETPQAESLMNKAYIAFIDAYGIQQKQTIGSKGAMYVFKRAARLNEHEKEQYDHALDRAVTLREKLDIHLKLGFILVCEYIDNPDDPRIFAEYCSRICTWYKCKALVEREPGHIHLWFLDNHKEMCQRRPLKHTELKIDWLEYGIKFDEYWKDRRRGYLQSYIEDHCNKIYFPALILDATQYDDTVQQKKKDSVDAFGGCLIHDGQEKLLSRDQPEVHEAPKRLFGVTRSGSHFKNTIR